MPQTYEDGEESLLICFAFVSTDSCDILMPILSRHSVKSLRLEIHVLDFIHSLLQSGGEVDLYTIDSQHLWSPIDPWQLHLNFKAMKAHLEMPGEQTADINGPHSAE